MIDADVAQIPVGVDGEALVLDTPVRCTVRPGALRVRVPRQRPGVPDPKPIIVRTACGRWPSPGLRGDVRWRELEPLRPMHFAGGQSCPAVPTRTLDHQHAVGYVGYFRRQIGTGQGMTQIPSVADGLLQGTAAGGAAGLAVGSPAWFAWLADDAARSFSFRSPAGTYTARKERRQRGGAYWVAYRTAAGRQHKVYLGKAEELTPERLAVAAAALAGRVAAAAETVGDTPTAPGGSASRTGQSAAGLPLLATKLFVPRPRPDLVPRPRLLARLDAGLGRGPVLAALGAGRCRQDQPAGRLARPAGSPGRLAHPRRARPGVRPGAPLPGRRLPDDRPRLRPGGAGLARRPAAAAARGRGHRAWSTTWPPCPPPVCWSWTTTTSCAPRPSTPRSPSCSTTCHRPCTW